MIFNNLKLKNFKSHVNSSINFEKGVTLVLGENGAGKSSIFEAITFALFIAIIIPPSCKSIIPFCISYRYTYLKNKNLLHIRYSIKI